MEVGATMHQRNRFFDFGTDSLPLSLSPGQTEYVPLMFLPRDDGIASVSRNTEYFDANVNNLDFLQLHNVIERIQSSQGTLDSPVRASSILSNPYGLPPTLNNEKIKMGI